MKLFCVFVALLAVAVQALSATSNPFCIVSNGNTTYDLNPIGAAYYNGTVVGSNGATDVGVHFGWCGPINSTACNVTNWAMTIEESATCFAGFEVFTGPASQAAGAVSFQLWGGTDGVIGSVSVVCNPTGPQGKASLTGLIINQPISSYQLTFSSVHACPSS